MMQIQALKSRTGAYTEIIQINVPVRFYWADEGFDGIEFGPFKEPLMIWEEDMLTTCLEALRGE